MPFTPQAHEHPTILSIQPDSTVRQECGGKCVWVADIGTYVKATDFAALQAFARGNPWPPEADLLLAEPRPGVHKPHA